VIKYSVDETFTVQRDGVATMSLAAADETLVRSSSVDALQGPWTRVSSQLTLVNV